MAKRKRSKRQAAADGEKKRADVFGIFPTHMECVVKVRPTDWPRLTIDAEFCITCDRVFVYPDMKALENRIAVAILDVLRGQNGETKGGAK